MGKERLAESGYYVGNLLYKDGSVSGPDEFQPMRPIYISPEGKCKYIYNYTNIMEWGTLMWTCAPTKKKCDWTLPVKGRCDERYTRFDTIEDLNAKYGKSFPRCPLDKQEG